jgi:hypothetical protein
MKKKEKKVSVRFSNFQIYYKQKGLDRLKENIRDEQTSNAIITRL